MNARERVKERGRERRRKEKKGSRMNVNTDRTVEEGKKSRQAERMTGQSSLHPISHNGENRLLRGVLRLIYSLVIAYPLPLLFVSPPTFSNLLFVFFFFAVCLCPFAFAPLHIFLSLFRRQILSLLNFFSLVNNGTRVQRTGLCLSFTVIDHFHSNIAISHSSSVCRAIYHISTPILFTYN